MNRIQDNQYTGILHKNNQMNITQYQERQEDTNQNQLPKVSHPHENGLKMLKWDRIRLMIEF